MCAGWLRRKEQQTKVRGILVSGTARSFVSNKRRKYDTQHLVYVGEEF